MKKITAVLMAALMLVLCACASAEGMVGGWKAAEDTAVTEELKALFDKAAETLMGVDYEPVAYLGSQLVAGTNHCFLCRATVVYPGAEPYWVLVYLYEDLQGSVSVLGFEDVELGDFDRPMETDD